MKCRAWFFTILLLLGGGLGYAWWRTPKPKPLPPGQIALKIMTLDLGRSPRSYVQGYLVGPLDGTPYLPPTKPTHSTAVVAFDPKQPLPLSLRVIWTIYDDAFHSTSSEGYYRSRQMTVDQWEHDVTIPIPGPIPARPEHLLLVFYPDDTVKVELLSQAQVDEGRMSQIVTTFQETWPGLYRPETAPAGKVKP